jgi:hypothetical protein
MASRDAVTQLGRRSVPFIGILLLAGIVVALIVFVPVRAAATLLGILSGAMLSYSLIFRSRHTVQIAVLWASIAITADAAYARLNDQASVTLANALTKMVDAVVKLADPLIRGVGLAAADPRVKVGAVAPEFVWAFILSLIVLMAASFTFAARQRR